MLSNDLSYRKGENLVYTVSWQVVVALTVVNTLLFDEGSNFSMFSISFLKFLAMTFIPITVLFLINNHILIPRLLLRNRPLIYVMAAILMIGVTCVVQMHFQEPPPQPQPPLRKDHNLLGLNMHPPLIMAVTYDFFIVGINIAIALFFQRYRERLIMERRLKTEADTRLNYLKAQIRPHFYMNMLNNLHGLIEVDSERAQQMVINMSQLMRYMVYNTSATTVGLAQEVDFIRNYLTLMKSRYPEEKLTISTRFPQETEMAPISVPPLLFIVFIENAFKHGISFRQHSWLNISINVDRDNVIFESRNSVPKKSPKDNSTGIGLANVKQRLNLIYKNRSSLKTSHDTDSYYVRLILPRYEDTHNNS